MKLLFWTSFMQYPSVLSILKISTKIDRNERGKMTFFGLLIELLCKQNSGEIVFVKKRMDAIFEFYLCEKIVQQIFLNSILTIILFFFLAFSLTAFKLDQDLLMIISVIKCQIQLRDIGDHTFFSAHTRYKK